MYDIKVLGQLGLVHVTLSGMMSVEEVARYIAELKQAFARHKLEQWSFLLDVTDCPIQQQDMLMAMGQHMATMPKARSIGIVTGSSLARMQVRRLFTQPYARITSTVADARAWVLHGTEPPVDTARPAATPA